MRLYAEFCHVLCCVLVSGPGKDWDKPEKKIAADTQSEADSTFITLECQEAGYLQKRQHWEWHSLAADASMNAAKNYED